MTNFERIKSADIDEMAFIVSQLYSLGAYSVWSSGPREIPHPLDQIFEDVGLCEDWLLSQDDHALYIGPESPEMKAYNEACYAEQKKFNDEMRRKLAEAGIFVEAAED